MRQFEYLLDLIARVHAALARFFVWAIGGMWRIQGKMPVQLRFSLAFALLALLMAAFGLMLPDWWCKWTEIAQQADFMRYLEKAGHLDYGRQLRIFAFYGAFLCLLAAVLAWVRKSFSFRLMECAWAFQTVVTVLVFRWTLMAPSILVKADHKAFDSAMRNNLWTGSFFALLILAILAAIVLLALSTSFARKFYSNRPTGGVFPENAGENFVENLRSGGKDPRFRSSLYWAISLFLLAIFGPFLIFCWGWEEPYGLPKGAGQTPQQMVVKKVKPKKKPKKLTVNPWSPYILTRMNIDDVVTLKELEEETRDTYEANHMAMGAGKGKKGGWPNGIEDSAIRFIRLKYRGGDWDQDMGKGSDYNLLIKFHEWTGFKIARDTEHREIQRLKFFPKKRSPPFVFLTGMRGINLSESEVKILRDYCLKEGGMLFIDNGGGYFGSSVRQMLRRVFPGKPLVDISNDDEIFQRPYVFPDGAPPFWHHDGSRALGIRDEGRWVVFYHPGDINDAWKDGHSGATDEVADQAYKLGVNIMYYAFTQYYRRHFGDE